MKTLIESTAKSLVSTLFKSEKQARPLVAGDKDPNQNWIISGKSGSGKTSYLESLIKDYTELGYRVLYFSGSSESQVENLSSYSHLSNPKVVSISEFENLSVTDFNSQDIVISHDFLLNNTKTQKTMTKLKHLVFANKSPLFVAIDEASYYAPIQYSKKELSQIHMHARSLQTYVALNFQHLNDALEEMESNSKHILML